MASRKPRAAPFLDDPSLYPEYAVLVKRQRLHHALRCGFHQHRTMVLLALVAVSIAASGAKMPSCGCHGKWKRYLVKGLSFELLAKHFEGVVSALGCMLAVTVTSLLVYPLHRWACATSADQANKKDPEVSSTTAADKAAVTIAAAVPSTIVWAIAVYGAGVFRWGMASGLCVGLLCAGLTLKSVSFVQTCVPAPGGGADNGVGSGTATTAVGSAATSLGSVGGSSSLLSGLSSLTFEEFVFFLLLAPSLVCQPRFLKPPARRPRSVIRAASEFFHAGLTYLTVHVTCSTFFAPALRVLAAAFHSSWAAADGWAALRAEGSGGWLHDTSSASSADFSGEVLEGGGGQEWAVTVATAGLAGMVVLSPMMHFFMFYAFWHCVCLGSAELWGYPDRNTYGPWWLVMDDIRDYFRMWSAPVSRWLSSSVQRPVLAAGRRVAGRRRARKLLARSLENGRSSNQVQRQQHTSASANGNAEAPAAAAVADGSIRWWWLFSVVCSFLASGVLHEAVAFIAMRRTFWPFNTLFLALSASMTPVWDTLFPVHLLSPSAGGRNSTSAGKAAEKVTATKPVTAAKPATATVSAAATSTAGGSCAVQNGGAAAASTTAQPQAERSEHEQPCPTGKVSDGATAALPPTLGKDEDHPEAKKGKGNGRFVSGPSFGRWRGRTAVAVYMSASVPLTLAVDYLVWQWWRHAVMVG